MKKMILCLLFSAIILGAGGRTGGEQNNNPTDSKEDYASLFPPPLKGWKASEVRVEESVIEELEILSFLGEAPKRLKLERTYTGLNHPGKLSIALDSFDFKTCGWISAIQDADAELKQALKKENVEPFSYKSYPGLRMHDEKNRLKGVVLMMTSGGCFGITVETPAGKSDVLDYLEASDLPKILAFLKRHS